MKRKIFKEFIIIGSFLILVLVACGGAASGISSPAKVVEAYLTALVDKDNSSLSTLSCSDWEPNAIMEVDSLLAYEVSLDGLSCEEIGVNGMFTLVNCQGKMNLSYNGEEQPNFDLSIRNYQVIDQDGEFLVCGYQ